MLPQIETITWIPISERKPEREGRYLVTSKEGKTDALLFDPEYGWWSFYGWDMPMPIAWAELPKRYRKCSKLYGQQEGLSHDERKDYEKVMHENSEPTGLNLSELF